MDVECEVADSSVCEAHGCDQNQEFECSVDFGLRCAHANQLPRDEHECKCCDYKIKFLCPTGKMLDRLWIS